MKRKEERNTKTKKIFNYLFGIIGANITLISLLIWIYLIFHIQTNEEYGIYSIVFVILAIAFFYLLNIVLYIDLLKKKELDSDIFVFNVAVSLMLFLINIAWVVGGKFSFSNMELLGFITKI